MSVDYDCFFNLNLAYERRPKTNILKAYADVCGVEVEDCKLFIHTVSREIPQEPYIVVHCQPTAWAGRNWILERWQEVVSKINLKTVIIGTGDYGIKGDYHCFDFSIAETAYLIQNASMFLGIDSFPFHIAQAVNTPSVVFFGSVDPKTRIVTSDVKAVVANDKPFAHDLPCLGCHHRKLAPVTCTDTCERGDYACEDIVSVDKVLQAVWATKK